MRYVRLAVFVGFVSTLLTIFLVVFPLFQFGILRFPNFLPTPFLIGMALAALVNFFIVGLGTVMLTHRVAGPMFSLVRQMRTLEIGNLRASLRVREKDDFKFVFRHFNEMRCTLLTF